MKEMSERRSIGRTKIAKGALLFFGESAGANSCTVTMSQIPAPEFSCKV